MDWINFHEKRQNVDTSRAIIAIQAAPLEECSTLTDAWGTKLSRLLQRRTISESLKAHNCSTFLKVFEKKM